MTHNSSINLKAKGFSYNSSSIKLSKNFNNNNQKTIFEPLMKSLKSYRVFPKLKMIFGGILHTRANLIDYTKYK